jgi:L-asparaginase II
LLAEQLRSGLSETTHHGAVAVVDSRGDLVAHSGEIDRPFYMRSAAKPFQATAAQDAGARLNTMELAMACASHRGFPVHIALIESMLAEADLGEWSLQCPHEWPLGERARHAVIRKGAAEKRRIWHNCSGKHAGFLRACVAKGWPIDSYLSPEHPLQRRVVALVSELGELDSEPVGVDGCGAPVLRTTARAMAMAFARLADEERLAPAFAAMHQNPALIGSTGEGDTEIGIAIDAVAKGGAAGCVGVALKSGLGVAVKSWDGSGVIANLGAVAALEQIGMLPKAARSALEPIARPRVLGGGEPVGHFEARLRLEHP